MLPPQAVTHFLNTRAGMAVMWVVALVCSYLAMSWGSVLPLVGDGGLALASANNWVPPGWLNWTMAMIVNAGIALMAVAINRTFNVLRNMTMLFGGLYAIISMAIPSVFCQIYGGTLVCLVVLACQFLIYMIYGDPSNTRTAFLVFFLMALTALVARAALFLIPIFILGTMQMRVFNPRTLIAMTLGMITPVWILLGLGILPLDAFAWPTLSYSLPQIFARGGVPLIITVGVTMFLGLVATLTNLYRTLSYNSRTRAYNGFIAVAMLLVMILMLIDYGDFLIYIPLLNLLTSIQIAHFLIWQNPKFSYIPVLVIIGIYIALYISNL